MADEFDAAAAAAELLKVVQETGSSQRDTLVPPAPGPLFRIDQEDNLVLRDGTLIRKKVEPLQLPAK